MISNWQNQAWAKHRLYRELFSWFGPEFIRVAGLALPENSTAKDRHDFHDRHDQIGTPNEPKELRPVWLRADKEWKRLFHPLKPLDDPRTWEAALLAAGVPREEYTTLDYNWAAERILVWALSRLANFPQPTVLP